MTGYHREIVPERGPGGTVVGVAGHSELVPDTTRPETAVDSGVVG